MQAILKAFDRPKNTLQTTKLRKKTIHRVQLPTKHSNFCVQFLELPVVAEVWFTLLLGVSTVLFTLVPSNYQEKEEKNSGK